jgi:hypothetical protein
MKIRASAFLGISVFLVVAAVWLAVPSRNVYGNPWSEQLVHECALADGTRARLYAGDGGGATTAFWYSVTVENGLLAPERQVAFSYSAPTLSELECRDDRIVVSGGDRIIIATSDLKARRDAPLTYWRGKPEITARTWGVIESVRLAVAACLVAVAGWLARKSFRNGNSL